MSRKVFVQVARLWLLAVAAAACFAQSITSGDVTGIVTDPTGGVVPNAAVTLTSVNTNAVQKSTTNAEGNYRFAFITPGPYKIAVTAPGFQNQERPGVTVTPGQPTTVNVQLTVAGTSTSVNVVEVENPLQTENADDTTAFTAEAIEDLPNPGGDLT
jgi:hypothetical protein